MAYDFEQYRGAKFDFEVTATENGAAVDFTSLPVTLVLTSPSGTVTSLRWLNGGSDGASEDGGELIRFYKTAAWTAANLSVGEYEVLLCEGTLATTQTVVRRFVMLVRDGRGGAVPTT